MDDGGRIHRWKMEDRFARTMEEKMTEVGSQRSEFREKIEGEKMGENLKRILK